MPHVVLVVQGCPQINSYHPDSSLPVVFHHRVPANGEISYYCPKLMTLVRFFSFSIAVLVCLVSYLVLQNLNLV